MLVMSTRFPSRKERKKERRKKPSSQGISRITLTTTASRTTAAPSSPHLLLSALAAWHRDALSCFHLAPLLLSLGMGAGLVGVVALQSLWLGNWPSVHCSCRWRCFHHQPGEHW